VQRFFVNAGIYVLEPGALDFAPLGEPFDMTSLFENLLQERREVAAFPIREYWLDIGRTEDLERANGEFADHFLGGHS
jgi:NDP-sugar pyrophosphorylase family protein